MFGNQTLRTLEFWRDMSRGQNDGKRVVYLSYRASPDEADAEKLFDLSARTVDDRWRAGSRDIDCLSDHAAAERVREDARKYEWLAERFERDELTPRPF